MNLDQLLNVDISSLTADTIREYASFAQSQANRNLSTWDRKEYLSPAARQAQKATTATGGRYDILHAGSLNEAKQQLASARRFLSDETRTQRGWERTKRDIIKSVNEETGSKLKYKDFDKFWDAYEKRKEIDPNAANREYKYRVWYSIMEELEDDDKSADEIAIDLQEQFDAIVREREEAHQQASQGASKYFQ